MTEKSTCGSSNTNPCSDLLDTINIAKGGDTIMVDGNVSHGQPINVCCENFISKSITIIGYNGQPRLTCNKTGQGVTILMFTSAAYSYMHQYYSIIIQYKDKQFGSSAIKRHYDKHVYGFNEQKEKNESINVENHLLHCVKYIIPLYQCYKLWTNVENINVHVENIYFVNGFILASDINVSFLRCNFIDASIHFRVPQDLHQVNQNESSSIAYCNGIELHLVKTNFLSELPNDNALLACIILKCDHVNVTILDSLIIGKTLIIVPGFKGGHMILGRVMFSGAPTLGRYIGICVDNHDYETQHDYRFQIEIFDSILKDIYPDDKMLNVLYEYLRVSYGAIYLRINGEIYLNVKNTTFIGNERAVGIDMVTGEINIENCSFVNHSSPFGGSVIHVVSKHDSLVIRINNSVFDNNKAGHSNDATFVEDVTYYEKIIFIGKQYVQHCSQNQVCKHYRCHYDVKHKTINVTEVNEMGEVVAQQSILLEGHGAVIRATIEPVDILDRGRQMGLVLNQCTFKNNEAENGHGGALYFDMYQAEIIKCIFMSNRAKRNGGAIYSSDSHLNIRSCILGDNYAVNGGGLYSVGTNQTNLISYSIIKENQVGSCGGGVWLQGGRLILEECHVTVNTALMDGGGFYIKNVTTCMTYSIIHGNKAGRHGGGGCAQMGGMHGQRGGTEFVLTWCTVTSNVAKRGGGVHLVDVTTNILYSRLENNKAKQQGCGGTGCNNINNEDNLFNIWFNKSCYMTKLAHGGGLYLCGVPRMNMSYSIINNNHAENSGGGVRAALGKRFVMTGCNIISNTAGYGGGLSLTFETKILMSLCSIVNNKARWGGGGASISTSEFVMTGCSVTFNRAMSGSGGGLELNACSTNMTHCRITSNQAWYGGGIYAIAGTVVMTICNITSNRAGENGGGVSLTDSTRTHMSYCRVMKNMAEYSGGGLYVFGGDFIMAWCDITSNIAKNHGGGVLLTDVIMANLSHSTIDQNVGKHAGGVGMYIFANLDTYVLKQSGFVMSWCDVTSNKAMFDGGGLWLVDITTVHVSHSGIHNNDAERNGGGVGFMNIGLNISQVVIIGCNFTSNTANQSGGGLYLTYVNINMSLCTIAHNQAGYGGGVSVGQGTKFAITEDNDVYTETMLGGLVLHLKCITMHMSFCNIVSNQAWQVGGGVRVWRAKLVVTGCNVRSNIAEQYGGGLSLKDVTMAYISHSSIVNNEVRGYGGGVHMTGEEFVLTLCDIMSNRAEQYGGGLWLYNIPMAKLSHSRIYQNYAGEHAGGVGVWKCKFVMIGCNMSLNTAKGDGGGLWMEYVTADLSQNNTALNTTNQADIDIRVNNVNIDNSLFNENRAFGQGDTCYMKRSSGQIHNSTFQQTYGGSHLVLRSSSITADNSTFVGGYVHVKFDSFLTLDNIIYINHNVSNTWKGAIISEGRTKYNGVMVNIKNNTSILINIDVLLQISPGNSVIRDLYVSCPYRHDIEVANISQNNKFILLKIVCKRQCGIGYNRFTSGNIHLKAQDNETVTEVFRTTVCEKCPYGGECSQTLSSKPMFWGGILESKLVFYPCITNCTSCVTNCSDEIFTICAPHRQGPICTECAVNYTEALFSLSCLPDSQCTDSWFLPVILVVGITYSFFLLFQHDFINFIFMVPIRNGISEEKKPLRIMKPDDQYYDSTFIVNLFYYFQDSSLIYIMTPYSHSDTSTVSSMKEIIAGLLEFRLHILHLGKDICIFPGLSAAKKIALKTLFFPLIWIILFTIYGVASCLNNNVGRAMRCRSANAFMLAILFSFEKLAVGYFSLIQCITIFTTNVLYVQATTECYTYWQILIILYLAICIVPFGFYLMLCTSYLKEHKITLGIFFLGCLFPLPVILYFIIILHNQHNTSASGMMAPDVHVTFNIIQGPYHTMKLFGIDVCWGGVIVLRRTLLIILYSLVRIPFLRSLLIFFLCCGFLLLHNIMLPYKNPKANIADTLSQGALTIISVINIIRAMLDSQQSVPLAPTQSILDIIDYTDYILQLWLPIAGISILILLLLIRILTSLKSYYVGDEGISARHSGGKVSHAIDGTRDGKVSHAIDGARDGKVSHAIDGASDGKVSNAIDGDSGGKVSNAIDGARDGKVSNVIDGASGGKVSHAIDGDSGGKVSNAIDGDSGGKVSNAIDGASGGKVGNAIDGTSGGKVSNAIDGASDGKVSNAINGASGGKASNSIDGTGGNIVLGENSDTGHSSGNISQTHTNEVKSDVSGSATH